MFVFFLNFYYRQEQGANLLLQKKRKETYLKIHVYFSDISLYKNVFYLFDIVAFAKQHSFLLIVSLFKRMTF